MHFLEKTIEFADVFVFDMYGNYVVQYVIPLTGYEHYKSLLAEK